MRIKKDLDINSTIRSCNVNERKVLKKIRKTKISHSTSPTSSSTSPSSSSLLVSHLLNSSNQLDNPLMIQSSSPSPSSLSTLTINSTSVETTQQKGDLKNMKKSKSFDGKKEKKDLKKNFGKVNSNLNVTVEDKELHCTDTSSSKSETSLSMNAQTIKNSSSDIVKNKNKNLCGSKKLSSSSGSSTSNLDNDNLEDLSSKKICKELRNLGVSFNQLSSASDDQIDMSFIDGEIVKPSICEMVKTKSRVSVQSTYNRRNSGSDDKLSKELDKSKNQDKESGGDKPKDKGKKEKQKYKEKKKSDNNEKTLGKSKKPLGRPPKDPKKISKKNEQNLHAINELNCNKISDTKDVEKELSNKQNSICNYVDKKHISKSNLSKIISDNDNSSSNDTKTTSSEKSNLAMFCDKLNSNNLCKNSTEKQIFTDKKSSCSDNEEKSHNDEYECKKKLASKKKTLKESEKSLMKSENKKQANKKYTTMKSNNNIQTATTIDVVDIDLKEDEKKINENKNSFFPSFNENLSSSVDKIIKMTPEKSIISVKNLNELIDPIHEKLQKLNESKSNQTKFFDLRNDDYFENITIRSDDMEETDREEVRIDEIIKKLETSDPDEDTNSENELKIIAKNDEPNTSNKNNDEKPAKIQKRTKKKVLKSKSNKSGDQPKRKYAKKNKTRDPDAEKTISKSPMELNENSTSDKFVKDIYDFNESGNNSDSLDNVASLSVKTSSSSLEKPPIYKRTFSTQSSSKTNLLEIMKDDKDDLSVLSENQSILLSQDQIKKESSQSENSSSDSNESFKPNKTSGKLKKVTKAKKMVKKQQKSRTFSDNEEDSNKKRKKIKKVIVETSDESEETNSSSGSMMSFLHKRASKSNKKSSKARRMKYFRFMSGPKRHRMASLNALAKVQCLYENESRSHEFHAPKTVVVNKDISKKEIQNDKSGDEEKDNTTSVCVEKSEKKKKEKSENSSNTRTLRNVPGLRGAGNLWELDDFGSSSDENGSDITYKGVIPRSIKKKKKIQVKQSKGKDKKISNSKKLKVKPVKRSKPSSSEQSDSEKNEDSSSSNSNSKRKRRDSDKDGEIKDLVVRKRMASLNAAAILSATYEAERHIDRQHQALESDEEISSDETRLTPKKLKETKTEPEPEPEDIKEDRPVSTSVVIVQDTDVTITGVYVNSSLGSSQEAYCKMQYRVQSSVTEERVLRPSPNEPPKSYTPLSALSSMRPPASSSTSTQPIQPTTIRAESPIRFPPSNDIPYPPPTIITAHPTASAFCAPPPHAENSGYYQPAGPLITSHLVPQPGGKGSIPSPFDPDSINLTQPPQSTSAAESSDSDVLITGSDLSGRPQAFRYGPQPGPYSRPVHQLHCPSYPASYYSPYSQHPQDMCYSPTYQPYYPTKVYPATQPYRRYIPSTYYPVPPGDIYDSPPSTAPPPSSSQIVPAGPSGPQHMDHYPGPPSYYGYSPGNLQCYSRGLQPYMDAPPYPGTCPCPMQTCPKNVHTGPLIGNNTSKGPGASHLTNSTIDPTNLPACKTEDNTPIVIKPEVTSFQKYHETGESIDHHCNPIENVAITPSSNYTINSKILEPEISISPARGSTGLPPTPIQNTAAQPIEQNPVRKSKNCVNNKNSIKDKQHTMDALNFNNNNNNNNNNYQRPNDMLLDFSTKTETLQTITKQEINDLIKCENVKQECVDDVIMIEDNTILKPETETITIVDKSPEEITTIRDSPISEEFEDDKNSIVEIESSVAATSPLPVIPQKRIRLSCIPHSLSKSPPLKNYKNFIKRTDRKNYLCTPSKYQARLDKINSYKHKMLKRLGMNGTKLSKREVMMKIRRVVMIPTKLKQKLNEKRRARILERKNRIQQNESINKNITNSSNDVVVNIESSTESDFEKLGCKNSMKTLTGSKLKGSQELVVTIVDTSKTIVDNNSIEGMQQQLEDKLNSNILPINSSTNLNENTKNITNFNCNSYSSATINSFNIDIDNNNKINSTCNNLVENKKQGNKKKSKSKLEIQDNIFNLENNNNNTFIHDNNNKKHIKMPGLTGGRRNRSRTRKFSNKKRHRVKQVELIEEIPILQKSNLIPKWSNGWSWIGEPFQAKVFLNSDDAPVFRTCYPAMQHIEGDIIRPRDCVLLRAGNRKYELPYVAKVAHLWENPIDGEMMMSLLWYYRPEHTEQGRQQSDPTDEVFASKHKDHNSVACIEDKCYVLTYNEYCRYRRALKGYQEGIEEMPSVVPPLDYEINFTKVPQNVSPELVMFCRRVYEFRLKRLLKTPSEKN